ncbi:MAG: MFS transporter [Pseudomonadota bacterium]
MNGHPRKWSILGILFLIRCFSGVQFQSIAAVSSDFIDGFGISLFYYGVIFASFALPGAIISLPGSAAALKWGAKHLMHWSVGLMLAGSVITVFGQSAEMQYLARVVAGTGAALITVIIANILAEVFDRKNMATAMAIYICSWPFGFSLALVFLPSLYSAWGGMVGLGVIGLAFAMLWVVAAIWVPDSQSQKTPKPLAKTDFAAALRDRPFVYQLLLVSFSFGVINAVINNIGVFGPLFLQEAGVGFTHSAQIISTCYWLTAFSVPLTGLLSDRLGWYDFQVIASTALFAAMVLLFSLGFAPILSLIAIGILSGFHAGPILRSLALISDRFGVEKEVTLGVFFALAYFLSFLLTVLFGIAAEYAKTASAAFTLAGSLLATVCFTWWMFSRAQSESAKRVSA